jgi:hypothetical protein
MKYKRIYTDTNWWLTVFQGATQNDLVLVATVSGSGCYDVALRCVENEIKLFHTSKTEFTKFAKDFGSRDIDLARPFAHRKIKFKQIDLETIETEN